MPRLRPKSFSALVLAAMVTVSLPLVGVLVASDLLMDRLVHDSTVSVYRAVEVSQLSQTLQEQITRQERRLRQFQVLGDSRLRAEIDGGHQEITRAIDGLLSNRPSADSRQRLVGLQRSEGALIAAFNQAQDPRTLPLDNEAFTTISDLSREIVQASQQEVYQEVGGLHDEEVQAERILLILASTCLPLTIVLVVVLSRIVARPIRQIDEGIHHLGQGDFATAITVKGPDDLVFLGSRLDWLRKQLAAYEQEKDTFASHLSHELKTPLASIHEAAELLAEELAGPLSEQQREVIAILRKNAGELTRLIEDLVGLTMARARKSGLHLDDIIVSELIAETIDAHRPAIANNGLRLDLAVPALTLRADRHSVKTVLDNLLSNAVKFTPPGGTIAVRAARQGDALVIEIHDSGPGIAYEERERIFTPFFQGSATGRGQVAGSGLGLAIASQYVAAHNGSLELCRFDEPGACFRVTLPLSGESP